jgi:CDGSH-type Zn-finger protein
MTENNNQKIEPKIEVRPNGPYLVSGNIPLVHKTQVVSEFGEPLAWKKDEEYQTEESYILCRCGKSSTLPLCDKTHRTDPYDGTEKAPIEPTAERQEILIGNKIIVKKDMTLCMDSGFCRNRVEGIDELIEKSDEPGVKALIMAMASNCPAGAYVFSTSEGEADIEPDLPVQIAATTEITSSGPINGPLWVTGNIKIVRSDGQPFETRNRVTLCTCGHSTTMPLCDGTHRHEAEEKAAQDH